MTNGQYARPKILDGSLSVKQITPLGVWINGRPFWHWHVISSIAGAALGFILHIFLHICLK